MRRVKGFWHRLYTRRTVTPSDELAQCLSNGIDYEPEGGEMRFPQHDNDNHDTLAAFRETGRIPHGGKVT